MKFVDCLSERVVFGVIIIGGFVGLLFVVPWFQAITGHYVDAAIVQLIDKGMAVLGTAIGVIVAAIWKTDKTEKLAANTIDTLASKVTTPNEPVAAASDPAGGATPAPAQPLQP